MEKLLAESTGFSLEMFEGAEHEEVIATLKASRAAKADLDELARKKCLPSDLNEDLRRNLPQRKHRFAARLEDKSDLQHREPLLAPIFV